MTWTLTIYMIACKAIVTLVIIKPMLHRFRESRAYLKNDLTLLSTHHACSIGRNPACRLQSLSIGRSITLLGFFVLGNY